MPVGLFSEEEPFGVSILLSNPVGTSSNASVAVASLSISGTVSVDVDSSVGGLPFVGWGFPSVDSIDVHD